MPRKCTVCAHQARGDIEKAMFDGGPLRSIAARFGIPSKSSLIRHRDNCIPGAVGEAVGRREKMSAEEILNHIVKTCERQARYAESAEARNDERAASFSTDRERRGWKDILDLHVRYKQVRLLESNAAVERPPDVRIVFDGNREARKRKWDGLKEDLLGILAEQPGLSGIVNARLAAYEKSRAPL